MGTKSRTFSYYLAWALVGLLGGLFLLFQQGYIQLTVFDHQSSQGTENATQTTGFSSAVAAASPSVVSIQTARYVETTHTAANELLQERFFGKDSPHAP